MAIIYLPEISNTPGDQIEFIVGNTYILQAYNNGDFDGDVLNHCNFFSDTPGTPAILDLFLVGNITVYYCDFTDIYVVNGVITCINGTNGGDTNNIIFSYTNYKSLVYVDGISGNNNNTGDILSPVSTLQHAYDISLNGATIVLQNNTVSYGSLSVSKNLTFISARGIKASVDSIDVINAQVSVYDIDFVTDGINVDNSGLTYGSLHVKNCNFTNVYPIVCKGCDYVSLHQNRFDGYAQAIKIDDSLEITASSNVFSNGAQAFAITNSNYVDIYNNTIPDSTAGATGPSNVNLRVIYVKMSASIIARKYVNLPSFSQATNYGYAVGVNVVFGPSFNYGQDYTVINGGLTISWDGLELDGELNVNDVLRIEYSESSLISSEGTIFISTNETNSRVDSNNITSSPIGIQSAVGQDFKVRYNDFYNTPVYFTGIDSVGNFSSDPLYTGPDYRIPPSSPDIDAADPDRWNTILQELGVGITGGGFTGIFSVQRPGVASFNRNLDKDGRHRNIRPDPHDVGAYEFGATGINPEPYTYVNENGYDIDVPGSITGPFATLDEGYLYTGPIKPKTNPLWPEGYTGPLDHGATGVRYGRYNSNDLELSSDQLFIDTQTKESIVYVYPSFSSCGLTGVFVGPSLSLDLISGDTGTANNPFRTIGEALIQIGSETGLIFVYPGFYPSFAGSPNVKLVGLPKITQIPLGKTQYAAFEEYGWTGINTSVFTNGSVLFYGTEDIYSIFQISGNKMVRFDFLVQVDSLEAKVSNPNNFISVKKNGSNLTLKYNTDGSTYSATTISTDTAYRTTITINGAVATLRVKGTATGSVTDLQQDITLVSLYTGPWDVNYTFTDNSLPGDTGAINNLLIEAGSITFGSTGMLGVTGVSTERKLFGIVGDNSITGLYDWYGAQI